MSITKNTHYIPCFWAALWNSNYFHYFLTNQHHKLKARKQCVFFLNIRANKIFYTNVENIFFTKKIGLAYLTTDEIDQMYRMHFPEENDDTKDADPGTFVVDFENHFSVLEKDFGYNELMVLIQQREILNLEHKTHVALFIVSQLARNPNSLERIFDYFMSLGMTKFEAFNFLKFELLGSASGLMNAVIPILSKQWIIYNSDSPLPLCDSTILEHFDRLYVIVSPYLFIHITKTYVEPETKCLTGQASKLLHRKLISHVIRNTHAGIASVERDILQKIMTSPTYHRQREKVREEPIQ